jgi:hypothetical protein
MSSSDIVFRAVKGTPLTIAEVDGNFEVVKDFLDPDDDGIDEIGWINGDLVVSGGLRVEVVSGGLRAEGDTLSHMLLIDASGATENVGLLLSGAPNWQSMDRGLMIGKTSSRPSANPTDAVFLYVSSVVAGQADLFARSEAGGQKRLTSTCAYLGTQANLTTSTFSFVTALELEAGRYRFTVEAHCSPDAAGGVELRLNTGAGFVASAFIAQFLTIDNATDAIVQASRSMGLPATGGTATGPTDVYCRITGAVDVVSAGRLQVTARNLNAIGTTSVLVGTSFHIEEVG